MPVLCLWIALCPDDLCSFMAFLIGVNQAKILRARTSRVAENDKALRKASLFSTFQKVVERS